MKREHLYYLLKDDVDITLNDCSNEIVESLNECYSDLKRYLEIAYIERYNNEDIDFDNLTLSIEKKIRLIEDVINYFRESPLKTYVSLSLNILESEESLKLDVKDVYDKVILDKEN